MFADVKISKITEEKKQRLVEPLVVNIIPSGLSTVRHLCYLDPELIWHSGNGPRLRLLNKAGKELKTVKTPEQHGVNGMSVSTEGDVMFCSDTHNAVYKIKGEEIQQFSDTGDCKPCGLHCCKNGDILVSLCSGKRARIERFGSDGLMKQSIEMRQNGQRLFKKPDFLSQNTTSDICVSDLNRVVVTTDGGSFRFNYHGGKFKSFRPKGICCNKLSHIVVADDINNVIHVINESGNLLSILDTSGQGILGKLCSPSSIAVDGNGYIWVGEAFSGFIKVLKYLELCCV